jgi:hypothetical protein
MQPIGVNQLTVTDRLHGAMRAIGYSEPAVIEVTWPLWCNLRVAGVGARTVISQRSHRLMRPTIPVADWRIALDLDATRVLLDTLPPPECGRTCPWCRNWAAAHAAMLPAALADSLRRLGLDLARPVDVYAYAEPAGSGAPIPTRVTFRVAGRLLSGPTAHIQDARLGRVRHYVPVESPAGALQPGISVAYGRDVGSLPGPSAADATPEVQVDLRIAVPWVLAEPTPAVYM